MKTVLVIEPFHEDGMKLLRVRDDVEVRVIDDVRPEAIAEVIADAHAITVRAARIDEDLAAKANRLEIVSRHGVGCDNVPVEQLTRRGIPVAIASGANSNSVAEHTMMMILSLVKQAARFDKATREGDWRLRQRPATIELAGRTVLIIGFGRIGRLVAPLCRAFGMRVLVCDIALDWPLARDMGCERADDYRAALDEAEFVTLHVPLTPETRNMIGRDEIARMPDGGYVINCARGGIVDEAALGQALEDGKLAGAGLDVFEQEPVPADHKLLGLPNVILSPHSAAMTREGARRMALMTAGNVLDHFDGRLAPEHVFNPEVFEVMKARAG